MAATIAAILIALTMLAGPAQAQEATIQEVAAETESVTAEEQNGEDSKVAAEAGDAVAQAGDGETGAVAKTNGTAANAQDTRSLDITQRQGNKQVAAAQQTVGSDDLLRNETAEVDNTNGGNLPNRIGPISLANCAFEIDQGATVTLRGTNNARVVISETSNEFTLTNNRTQLTITGPGGDDLVGSDIDQLGVGTQTIIGSTGISCEDDDGDGGDGDGGAGGDGDGDGRRDRDRFRDLEDASCARLLQLFRNDEADGQYFAADVVLNRVEFCLRQEIIDDTAADGKLPDTGGPTLLGIAVLGLAACVAGAFVFRSGTRDTE